MSSIASKGWGVRLDGNANSSNWLHLAIPTAVIVEDQRLRIDSVMLRLKASGSSIVAVHVYDGETKIAAHDALSLSPSDWSMSRFDVSSTPLVFWGIGISFKVQYSSASVRALEISAGGADFLP
jgi:hypothetical protein